jgi:hypothetical protein
MSQEKTQLQIKKIEKIKKAIGNLEIKLELAIENFDEKLCTHPDFEAKAYLYERYKNMECELCGQQKFKEYEQNSDFENEYFTFNEWKTIQNK